MIFGHQKEYCFQYTLPLKGKKGREHLSKDLH